MNHLIVVYFGFYSGTPTLTLLNSEANIRADTMTPSEMEDDVILIKDEDFSVKEEFGNTSVVNCQIWINETSPYETKSTFDKDSKNWQKKHDSHLDLRDPLCDEDGETFKQDDDSKIHSSNLSGLYSECDLIDLTSDEDISTKPGVSGNGLKKGINNSSHSKLVCDIKPKLEISPEIVKLKPRRLDEILDPILRLTRDAVTILDAEEKVFQCPHCEYRNDKPSRISKHIKTHIKYRRFLCAHCDYRAYYKTALQNHIIARHTKEKPYKCMYCSYRCAQTGTLLTHIRSRHLKH